MRDVDEERRLSEEWISAKMLAKVLQVRGRRIHGIHAYVFVYRIASITTTAERSGSRVVYALAAKDCENRVIKNNVLKLSL